MSPLVTPVLVGRVQGNDVTTSSFTNEVDIGDRMWGDVRMQENEGGFRIGFWNCGGIPLSKQDGKNFMIRDWIRAQKFDVIGLSELNVHWPLVPSSNRLRERTIGWFPSLHMSTAFLSDWPAATPAQVGGVSLWSIDRAAHRVITCGHDPRLLGRWAWTTLRGKNGVSVRIVSAYRSVDNQSGAMSAWNQQRHVLQKIGIMEDPRKQFVSDLALELQKWLLEGDTIILGLDLNEPLLSSSFTEKMTEIGLINILNEKHGPSPPTYIRGSTTIDGLFVTPSIQHFSCGFLPFLGDHRPSWIDIPFDFLFGTTSPRTTRARRLQLQDPRVVHRYNLALHAFATEHHLFERTQTLAASFPDNSSSSIREYNEIDRLRQQGMQHAERHCRKLRMGAIPYTPEYSKRAQKVLFWRLVMRIKQGYSVDSRYFGRVLRRTGYQKDYIRSMDLASVGSQLQSAYRMLNAYSKQATESRQSWLEEVAQAKALLSGLTPSSELNTLLHHDRQKTDARIVKSVTGSNIPRGLALIQLSTEAGIVSMTREEDMVPALCDQLSQRFHQARETPFASAPLLQLVGPIGTDIGAQQILDGTFICPPGTDMWTQKLIKHLRYVPQASRIRNSFPLQLSALDHAAGWKKMKERTSPGYSQLSFAQFKAASLSPDLCEMDAVMSQLPYQFGFSPLRWQHGTDVMLQKQPGNFLVDKLRAILLYESDFNQNNKRYGKDLMNLAEQHNALAIEQFGSRRAMSAIDQSLNKTLTFDLWRQSRSSGALCSNDAKSCYDRIVHNFASICLQRLGSPIPPIQSMFGTIQRLSHHIRTVHGDSKLSFSGKDWHVPIHGVGQGNGAGPQIWAAVSTPLLNLLRAEGCGSHLSSVITKEHLHFVGYAFVDDTDLVSSHPLSQSPEEIYHNIQYALDAWRGGLTASGGAIVPEKSHWYLISFQWKSGVASYCPAGTIRHQLTVLDTNGRRQPIKLLEPTKAAKTLGVFLAPDGNMISQASYMTSKVTEWCDKLRSGKLPRHLSAQALLTTISKTLEYPLPATTLSKSQCIQIMKPLLQQCLPSMGIVRTFPRTLAHATPQFLGLEIPNLYWLQGYAHLDRLLRYHRSQHLTGRILRHSLELLRLEIGCNGSIFALPYQPFEHLLTPSWLSNTWQFLSDVQLRLDIHIPELHLFRERDSLLMQCFLSKGFSSIQLRNINVCRLFLQVATVSDITTGCGQFITYAARHRTRDSTLPSIYTWPFQGQPSQEHWNDWTLALKSISNDQFRLQQPLGKWVHNHHRHYFFDPPSNRIYSKYHQQCKYYRTMNCGRASRSSIDRFGDGIDCHSLPRTCHPATVDQRGSFLHLTGYMEADLYTDPPLNSFLHFIQDQCPVTARWALRNIEIIGNVSAFFSKFTGPPKNLFAVSDGSFKDNHGTASWRISWEDSDEYLIGRTVVPGSSSVQSAYRSELTGLYGIAITLWALRQFYTTSFFVTIGCDGLSAINQFHYLSDTINPNTQHFDLISATRWLLGVVKGSYTWRHIKGHQDSNQLVTLDMWAQFNIQMDDDAKSWWSRTAGLLELEREMRVFGEVGCVWIGSNKVVTDLKSQIMGHISSIKAIPQWEKHFNWVKGSGQRINWSMLGYAAQQTRLSRRTWIIKHASGFFSSGKMMVLRKQRDSAACPRCHDAEEDATHIVQCPHPDAVQNWNTAMAGFESWLVLLPSAADLAKLLCAKLQHWHSQSTQPFQHPIPAKWAPAFAAQDTMGWESFLQGFWVLEWEGIQHEYLISIQSKLSVRRWISSIIRKLWDICWDLWDQRNAFLHDKEQGLLNQQLNRDIEELYREDRNQFLASDRILFRTPLPQLLSSSIANKQMWVARIKTAKGRWIRSRLPFYNERAIMNQWLRPQGDYS